MRLSKRKPTKLRRRLPLKSLLLKRLLLKRKTIRLQKSRLMNLLRWNSKVAAALLVPDLLCKSFSFRSNSSLFQCQCVCRCLFDACRRICLASLVIPRMVSRLVSSFIYLSFLGLRLLIRLASIGFYLSTYQCHVVLLDSNKRVNR